MPSRVDQMQEVGNSRPVIPSRTSVPCCFPSQLPVCPVIQVASLLPEAASGKKAAAGCILEDVPPDMSQPGRTFEGDAA